MFRTPKAETRERIKREHRIERAARHADLIQRTKTAYHECRRRHSLEDAEIVYGSWLRENGIDPTA